MKNTKTQNELIQAFYAKGGSTTQCPTNHGNSQNTIRIKGTKTSDTRNTRTYSSMSKSKV